MEKRNFEEYILRASLFRGSLDGMANSIELILGFILEKLDIKVPKMLGGKIDKLANCKNTVIQINHIDPEKLTIKLTEFNNIWVITKHGMIVGGLEELTFDKDGKRYTFNQNKQAEINRDFTEIMAELTKIYNTL